MANVLEPPQLVSSICKVDIAQMHRYLLSLFHCLVSLLVCLWVQDVPHDEIGAL